MITLDTIYYRLYNHYGKQHWWPAKTDIEMIISAILVQNTSWNNVEKALANFDTFDGEEILNLSFEQLIEKIKPAGFYKRKSQTIHNTLTWFQAYNFDINRLKEYRTETLRNEILAIKGIGEETCDCILLYACKRPVFVVDTYLKRLLKKMKHPIKGNYAQIQEYVMHALPHSSELFQEYHALIVEYGKSYLKTGEISHTDDPLLNQRDIIPYTLKQLEMIRDNKIIHSLIEQFGYVERTGYPDPFWGTIYAIIGQLISTKAASSIMKRFIATFPNQDAVHKASIESLQKVGLTKAKATYIHNLMINISLGKFSFETVSNLNTEEAITYLCTIKGIGLWSAKIILIHSYNHLNIDLYEDVALRNAVKKQLNLPNVDREVFALFMKQFEPYKTIACIYLWHYIANT